MNQNRQNNEIKKFLQHKKLFNIKDSVYLNLFEDLIINSKDNHVERSCKIENGNIHPIRFDVRYNNKDHIKNINLIFKFSKKISQFKDVTINYSLIKKIFYKNFKLDKTQRVGCGIDYRGKIEDSRIKIAFIIQDYSEKINQVLSIHGYNKDLLDLIFKNELLFSFDFYFDGRTKTKIYLEFNEDDLNNISVIKKYWTINVCVYHGWRKSVKFRCHFFKILYFFYRILFYVILLNN